MILAAACLILGDSHAHATANALRAALGPRCAVEATDGISSSVILSRTPSAPYGAAIISAGANDARNPRLAGNLDAIRGKLQVGKVVWLLPYNRRAASAVSAIARRWGDLVVDLAWARARSDGIHCQSYSWVARSIARAGYVGPLNFSR